MNTETVFEFFRQVDLVKPIVFAFTGDIDNLGLFVAGYGRAQAECLVDDYNHIINDELNKLCETNDLHLLLSLSGEEVFGIGIANNWSIVSKFENFLKLEINRCLKERSAYFQDYVTISFGLIRMGDRYISDIQKLRTADCLNNEQKEIITNMIYTMRVDLTISLDSEKFLSLPHSDKNDLIFYRNIVYTKMIQYKRETRELLIKMSSSENFKTYSERFGSKYGVNEEDYCDLKKSLAI